MRILIIEDDSDIAANLLDYLESRGHSVSAAADGLQGFQMASEQAWDAILLDLTLPGMDGLALCRALREQAQCETPVLMLTARDTLDNKVDGFAAGADDYLVKPYALREVEIRLLALNKRREGRVAKTVLRIADITYDLREHTVTSGESEIKMAPKCQRMLELFMHSPNQILTRSQIEMAVWGELQPDSDTLRSHVYALRRALAGTGAVVETVHGQGYRVVAAHAG